MIAVEQRRWLFRTAYTSSSSISARDNAQSISTRGCWPTCTGDGRADIVGFGDDGVWTALSNGDGTFQPARFVLSDFGVNNGWRVDQHPRFLADLTGDGRADIVGFGDDGVWIALNTFTTPALSALG